VPPPKRNAISGEQKSFFILDESLKNQKRGTKEERTTKHRLRREQEETLYPQAPKKRSK